MMKLVIFSALVAFAAADVSHLFKGQPPLPVARPGQVVGILRSESDIHPDGSYQYAYEAENGIAVQQQGQLKVLGHDAGNVAQGSYRYTSPEGVPVFVQYVADENGYQPQSDLLPTPPPIPAAILRSIEYNAAHPEPQQAAPQRRFRRHAVVYY